jgi:HlyD family secretion protein
MKRFGPAPIVAAVGAAALAVGCTAREGHRRPMAREAPPRVEVVRPTVVESFPRRIELTVTVEPMAKVDLCARVPGVVKDLPDAIDIGRRVKRGDRLVVLDVSDMVALRGQKQATLELARQQRAQVVEARKVLAQEVEESKHLARKFEAEYNARSDEYNRTRMLVERNAQAPEVAQEKLRLREAALAAWEAAQAQAVTKGVKLKAADVDEAVAEGKVKVVVAELENLDVQIGYATLTAPFDGVVTKRWVDPGATVKDASMPLLTLMRIDRVRVLMDVPDRDAALVNATEQNPNPDGRGDPVTLHFAALAGQGETRELQGFIDRKAEARDPATRTMRAEIHIDNPSELLQPGMYGSASVLLERRRRVVTVPSSAVMHRGDGYEVWYIESPDGGSPRGVLKSMRVQLGIEDGTRIEVLSPLPPGTWIVTKRNSVVVLGDDVVGQPANPP